MLLTRGVGGLPLSVSVQPPLKKGIQNHPRRDMDDHSENEGHFQNCRSVLPCPGTRQRFQSDKHARTSVPLPPIPPPPRPDMRAQGHDWRVQGQYLGLQGQDRGLWGLDWGLWGHTWGLWGEERGVAAKIVGSGTMVLGAINTKLGPNWGL